MRTENSFTIKDASFLHGILVCANEKGFQGLSGISGSSSFTFKPLKECKKSSARMFSMYPMVLPFDKGFLLQVKQILLY